jgi:putative transcriptional regulator
MAASSSWQSSGRIGVMANFLKKDQPISKPYHYRECGLDDVYLLNGYRKEKTPYGNGVAVEDEDELLHVIALSLVHERPLLSGKELRFLRRRMDMTQSELAKVLRTDVQTIARWEKGRTKISGPADGGLSR